MTPFLKKKNKKNPPQLSEIWDTDKAVYSNTDLSQETRKISNNQTYHLKELEKEE